MVLPEKWSIGVIVGNSGTGKSTIAKELFPEALVTNFEYSAKSVIDDMPRNVSVDQITRMFYAVGFGSVPDWLKPYKVLSVGEKMRVDIARALLSGDFVVFDEFTSTVDREIAKTCCIAIRKTVERTGKKFIAVTCHKDVVDYLQPDFAFSTDVMRPFALGSGLNKDISFGNATEPNGENLATIII